MPLPTVLRPRLHRFAHPTIVLVSYLHGCTAVPPEVSSRSLIVGGAVFQFRQHPQYHLNCSLSSGSQFGFVTVSSYGSAATCSSTTLVDTSSVTASSDTTPSGTTSERHECLSLSHRSFRGSPAASSSTAAPVGSDSYTARGASCSSIGSSSAMGVVVSTSSASPAPSVMILQF